MIGIVVSEADEASVHIGDHLLERADWTTTEDHGVAPADGGGTVRRTDRFELRTFEGLHIELDDVTHPFADLEALVFASRHSGETGPLLTAHFTGNVGAADFGGNPGTLAQAWPSGLAQVYRSLRRGAPDGYAVGIECTHHGPTDIDVPSMFVEVGSAEPQWRDGDAARAVATAILRLEPRGPTDRTFVGFGGGHYAPRFERIISETDWRVGHVLADWSLDEPGEDRRGVIEQAFDRSHGTLAVIEGDRPALVETIEDLGHRVVSETWLRETESIPLDLVDRLERELEPVADGLRFGTHTADPAEIVIYQPPADLLADLHGIDPEATVEAIATNSVAFETVENGNRVSGRIALPDESAKSILIDALADVLRRGSESVERTDEGLLVEETAFDPDRARELGVPEGPAFGKLTGGQSVEIDGETVTPEMVHVERERRYRL